MPTIVMMLVTHTHGTTIPRAAVRGEADLIDHECDARRDGRGAMSPADGRAAEIRASFAALLEDRNLRAPARLRAVASFIRDEIGCQGVAIRLVDNDGNAPFQAQRGFPESFCARRNLLRVHCDRCLCARLLDSSRWADPAPSGSVVGRALVYGTAACMKDALVSGADPPAHMVCPDPAFETTALVPICGAGFPLGLLHCADPRPDFLSAGAVALLEALAHDLGRALFFDSIWPAPWVPPGERGVVALCPVCGRRRRRSGEWFRARNPQAAPLPLPSARRILCPDCISLAAIE